MPQTLPYIYRLRNDMVVRTWTETVEASIVTNSISAASSMVRSLVPTTLFGTTIVTPKTRKDRNADMDVRVAA
jgi:hypothetical protein